MKSPPPISRAGLRLYAELPEEYRHRDNPDGDEPGDLEAYLHGFGLLLDRVRATLEQLHADSFPQGDEIDHAPQGWVLPYIADLLGAELLAPDATARALELENAISWRQGKGTLTVVDGIGDAISGSESVLAEGWRRVLTTPRPTLPPFAGQGAAPRWPGTPDLRFGMRAVQRENDDDPLLRLDPPFLDDSSDRPAPYRIANPEGVPLFPDSYEDQAVRTPDLHALSHDAGHHHPRAVVSYLRPPPGFFATDRPARYHRVAPSESLFEDERFDTLTVPGGRRCTLLRCTVKRLIVEAASLGAPPAVVLRDSLVERVEAAEAFVEMEYVTVTGAAALGRLWASDCLFAGELTLDADSLHCVRYSRVPRRVLSPDAPQPTNTDAVPRFLTNGEVGNLDSDPGQPVPFGQPGCGVLHPATPAAITAGAEDNGELGAYHHAHHMTRLVALRRKLADHTPLGIEAVPVYDPRLLRRPPRANAMKE